MIVLTSYFCKRATQSPFRPQALFVCIARVSYVRGRLLVLFPSLFSVKKGRARSSAEFELLVRRNNGTSSIVLLLYVNRPSTAS